MTTPDKNFRLNKTTKRMIALMKGSAASRNHFKRIMIDAQLTADAAHKQAMRSKERKNEL